MFLFHAAFSLGMIALTVGTALYIWSSRNEGKGTGLAKIIGLLVIILSIISSICASYYAIKYQSAGFFQTPTGAAGHMTGENGMMNDQSMQPMTGKCMECCKNMMSHDTMKPGMGNKQQSNQDNHKSHHPR